MFVNENIMYVCRFVCLVMVLDMIVVVVVVKDVWKKYSVNMFFIFDWFVLVKKFVVLENEFGLLDFLWLKVKLNI